KRNALSIELRTQFAEALRGAARDDAVRCTLVTGSGSAFCAGMDTSQFGAGRPLVDSTEAFLGALLEHPKPLVAAVNGPALGGGFVLALLCDLRLASESARFGFPEVARGIPASYGAARAALPAAVATDLALTGRVVDAAEAMRLGIVSEVIPGPGFAAHAAQRAAELASLPASATATVTAWARADRAGAEALLALEREAFRAAVLRD
ncbi:MAG: enoyl-CoA hydratase/isomerase family protein, partial [Myxococcales bacterium]